MSVIQEQFNNNPEKNMVLIKMDKGRQNKHKKMRNSASISSSCSGGDNASSSCDSVIGGQHDSTKQSLKHLSASAPAMRTDLGKGETGEFFMAPSSSKSRQKKFHRHFTKVPTDEKVLDYYSCALVGDILLQGFLYISENYFAFYSNVFGYVTKLLIPITTVVKITKERTAKIFPNAVGIVTQSERHVFASLISRDTTFKLMSKVWLHHSKQSLDTLIIPKDSSQGFDDTSGDIVIADDSSGDSSGNDSALDPSSCSASPQNTPGLGLQNLLHVKLPNTTNNNNNVIAHNITQLTPAQREDVNLKLLGNAPIPIRPHLISSANLDNSSSSNVKKIENQQNFRKRSEPEKPLLILATVLLVILFISAAFLLIRISHLQEKLSDRPSGSNSEQFYQDLLSWQNRLHSNSAEEIHQFIDTNLQQIVRVRESLEALSTLFMNGGRHNSAMGDHVSTHSHFANTER
ncbi:GRAM domain-containing protein 2A isoform X2 [Folsomia candida]|uniref:GRAM domain-containing protein 2A isoform X2 n=1 Tax=Folsomia candida TaxID=158441 RepID=UPI000B9027AA|nr:GRAM domain-containing protein 2A isoform X2 [Folsomia candida]